MRRSKKHGKIRTKIPFWGQGPRGMYIYIWLVGSWVVWLLDFAQTVNKTATGFHFDMAGLPPIQIGWQGCNIREICWKITRFHSPWVGLRPSLRLGEFGEEFGGHCLPSYRVACRTIAVAHHCLAPTTRKWCTRNHTMVPIHQQTTPESSHRRAGSG